MKHTILAILFALALCNANAQRTAPDTLQTGMDPLIIQPVQHASLILSIHGITIYADPSGAVENYKGLVAPNIILITDIHLSLIHI